MLDTRRFIGTTNIDLTGKILPRRPGEKEVVVLNNHNNDVVINRQIIEDKIECLMPDQRIVNPNCKLNNPVIPDDSNQSFIPNLNEKNVVILQDVNKLTQTNFGDTFDISTPLNTDTGSVDGGSMDDGIIDQKIAPPQSEKPKPKGGKIVGFLEKFGDDKSDETEYESWDTYDNKLELENPEFDAYSREGTEYIIEGDYDE